MIVTSLVNLLRKGSLGNKLELEIHQVSTLDLKNNFEAICIYDFNEDCREIIERTEFLKDTRVKKKPIKLPNWQSDEINAISLSIPENNNVLIRNKYAEFFVRNWFIQEIARYLYIKFDLMDVDVKEIMLDCNETFKTMEQGFTEIGQLIDIVYQSNPPMEQEEEEREDDRSNN